jgi:hypothetical protein
MRRAPDQRLVGGRSPGHHRLLVWLLAALAGPGCGHKPQANYTSISQPPTVKLINP